MRAQCGTVNRVKPSTAFEGPGESLPWRIHLSYLDLPVSPHFIDRLLLVKETLHTLALTHAHTVLHVHAPPYPMAAHLYVCRPHVTLSLQTILTFHWVVEWSCRSMPCSDLADSTPRIEGDSEESLTVYTRTGCTLYVMQLLTCTTHHHTPTFPYTPTTHPH